MPSIKFIISQVHFSFKYGFFTKYGFIPFSKIWFFKCISLFFLENVYFVRICIYIYICLCVCFCMCSISLISPLNNELDRATDRSCDRASERASDCVTYTCVIKAAISITTFARQWRRPHTCVPKESVQPGVKPMRVRI